MWAVGAIIAELYMLRPLFPGSSEIDEIFKGDLFVEIKQYLVRVRILGPTERAAHFSSLT